MQMFHKKKYLKALQQYVKEKGIGDEINKFISTYIIFSKFLNLIIEEKFSNSTFTIYNEYLEKINCSKNKIENIEKKNEIQFKKEEEIKSIKIVEIQIFCNIIAHGLLEDETNRVKKYFNENKLIASNINVIFNQKSDISFLITVYSSYGQAYNSYTEPTIKNSVYLFPEINNEQHNIEINEEFQKIIAPINENNIDIIKKCLFIFYLKKTIK